MIHRTVEPRVGAGIRVTLRSDETHRVGMIESTYLGSNSGLEYAYVHWDGDPPKEQHRHTVSDLDRV